MITVFFLTDHFALQYDEGAGRYALKGKFTSFVKTRMICSVPGEMPFDYDQIRKCLTKRYFSFLF